MILHDIEHFMDLASEIAIVKSASKRHAALRGLERRMIKAGMSKCDMSHVSEFYKAARNGANNV
jgi:hypothetical protein